VPFDFGRCAVILGKYNTFENREIFAEMAQVVDEEVRT